MRPAGRKLVLASLQAALLSVCFAGDDVVITGRTAEARPAVGFTPVRLFSKAGYKMKTQSRRVDHLPPSVLPEDLSGAAKFGLIALGEHLTTCIIDGDFDSGYSALVDLNMNGDLTDDAPHPMGPDGEGSVAATVVLGEPPYPMKLSVALDESGEPVNPLRQHLWTERDGTIVVGDREIAFRLLASGGDFANESSTVFFDLDGDGEIASFERYSDERYGASAGLVNIDGASYEFAVGEVGDSLTLTRLAEFRPGRVRLEPGNPAPDFGFRDLDGVEHRLSDYKGKLVLLYFWGSWCLPCQQETPALIELYEAHRDEGFEIIGINKGDFQEAIRTYVEQYGIAWVQAPQDEDESIIDLYRVQGFPSEFLIGRDGAIVFNQIRAAGLEPKLGELLEKDTDAEE